MNMIKCNVYDSSLHKKTFARLSVAIIIMPLYGQQLTRIVKINTPPLFPFFLAEHHSKSEKVSYAKKMAQGYLRSMGMGEWTPKTSAPDSAKGKQATVTLSPAKQVEPGVAATHKSRNNNNIIDDDQDFDF